MDNDTCLNLMDRNRGMNAVRFTVEKLSGKVGVIDYRILERLFALVVDAAMAFDRGDPAREHLLAIQNFLDNHNIGSFGPRRYCTIMESWWATQDDG